MSDSESELSPLVKSETPSPVCTLINQLGTSAMVQISAADSYGKGATVSGKRVKEDFARSRTRAGYLQDSNLQCASQHSKRPPNRHRHPRNRNVTFLARARCSGRCIEDSNVPLTVCRTRVTGGRSRRLLVEIAEVVATDATELPLLGLEVTCMFVTSCICSP